MRNGKNIIKHFKNVITKFFWNYSGRQCKMNRMVKKIIATVVLLFAVGFTAAPLFSTDDRCDAPCCPVSAPVSHPMNAMESCPMVFTDCSRVLFIPILAAPYNTVDLNQQFFCTFTADDIIHVPEPVSYYHCIRSTIQPEPPPAHLIPLRI
jgi:hypothetical protein